MSGARRRRKHPLPAVVVLPVGKLGQYVGRITATVISQASQLVSVAPLARQLNELVDGITAAVIGKRAQLIQDTRGAASRSPVAARARRSNKS